MSNTVKKPTKKANYNAILSILSAAEGEGLVLESTEITYDSLREFIEHEVELLDNKAAAAAKRAQAKRDEGDALRARILEIMSTEDFMTIPEIVKAIGDEDVSAQMVTARLTQCVKADLAEKDSVSVEVAGKAKKLSGYRKLG